MPVPILKPPDFGEHRRAPVSFGGTGGEGVVVLLPKPSVPERKSKGGVTGDMRQLWQKLEREATNKRLQWIKDLEKRWKKLGM